MCRCAMRNVAHALTPLLLPRSFIPRIKLPPLLNKKERFEDVKAPTCFFPTSVVPSIQPDSPFQFDEYDSQGTRLLFVVPKSFAVLRIHYILVRIWIRILGSMPLTNGYGSPSCFFVIDLQNAYKKVFCLFLFDGTFTSFFKVKKVKKKSQNSRNIGLLTIFA